MADNIIDLNEEQLRKLSKAIHEQEVEAVNKIKFKSETDHEKYLEDCHAGHKIVTGLLDAAAEFKKKCENDAKMNSAADEIYSYILCCTNTALQMVQNYSLRLSYLQKIKAHADLLLQEGVAAMNGNAINVQRLAKDAALYRNAVMHYTRKQQSEVFRKFSENLKAEGLKFDKLIERYQEKLGFSGSFKDLPDEQKLTVYEEIIKASGRGNAKVSEFVSSTLGKAGRGLLLLTAGLAVWDIYSSEHKVETAIHDAVEIGAGIGGGMLGELIGTAIATGLFAGIAAPPVFIAVTGIVAGFAGAFIVSKLAGSLVDTIIGSGVCHPTSTDDHECAVVLLPNVKELAYKIKHDEL